MGQSLEPQADCPTLADRLPGRQDHAHQHEAIVQGRGALRRELTACLRTGRVLRMPRARVRRRGKGFVSPEIIERPAEAADRAVPGHWGEILSSVLAARQSRQACLSGGCGSEVARSG